MLSSRKEMLAHCLAVPFFNCMMMYMSTDFMVHILNWKLPRDGAAGVVHMIISYCFIGAVSALIMCIPLMLVCLCYFSLLKKTVRESAESYFLPLKRKKIIWYAILLYVVFTPCFYLSFKEIFGENNAFPASATICMLSFLSISFVVTHILTQTIKMLFFCILLPVFWSFFPVFYIRCHDIYFYLEHPDMG
jgi:hypothetical protein